MTQSFSNGFYDRPIPAFSHGKFLHHASINAFPEVTYLESVKVMRLMGRSLQFLLRLVASIAESIPDVKQST